VTHLQAGCFTVKCASEFPIQVDGELLGRDTEAHFRPMERKLRVLAPEQPMISRFGESMKALWGWTRKMQGVD
jgi:diacylglycerol kinase family enzyme